MGLMAIYAKQQHAKKKKSLSSKIEKENNRREEPSLLEKQLNTGTQTGTP